MKKRSVFVVALIAALGAVTVPVLADGSETLGRPTAMVPERTSGVAISGTGLFSEPAELKVELPAGAEPTRVLLYWESLVPEGDVPDDTIQVDGEEITGTAVGGPDYFFGDLSSITFRVDITDRRLVQAGPNTLTVGGLSDTQVDDGVGIMVFYDEPGVEADVELRDGNDTAFIDFPAPRDTTTPQTFTFAAADVERTAEVGFLVTSVRGGDPEGPRPHAAYLTSGGETTRLDSPFTNNAGEQFDYYTTEVTIPAGASDLTIQLTSESDGTDNLPASLVWLATYVATPAPQVVEPDIEPEPEPDTEVLPEIIEAPVDVPEAPEVLPIELLPQFTG